MRRSSTTISISKDHAPDEKSGAFCFYKKNWKKVPHDLLIQNIVLHLKCCNDATNQNNHKMKNQEKNTIQSSAKKTFMFGQVFVDVTPQAVYDYLDSLDENDIVQRTKYDLSI